MNHVSEARHQRIATRRANGKQADVSSCMLSTAQTIADGCCRQLSMRHQCLAFGVDGVMPLPDAVLTKNARLDAFGNAVEGGDISIHAFIVDSGAGQVVSSRFDIDTIEAGWHQQISLGGSSDWLRQRRENRLRM